MRRPAYIFVLSESLKTIRADLTNVMRNISQIAGQVDTSADQVSTGEQTLSQGTLEQSVSIEGLVSNVTTITTQIQDSAIRCGNASELVDKATGFADEADAKNTGSLIGRSIEDVKVGTESTQAKTLNILLGQFRIR